MSSPRQKKQRDRPKPIAGEHGRYGLPPKPYVRGAAKPLVWCEACDRFYSDPCDKHDQ